MIMENQPADEAAERNNETCCGCGKAKELPRQVVCWKCFKYRTDVTPLKYFDGSLTEWLEHIRVTKANLPPGH